MKIRITKAESWNWYNENVGEVFAVRDFYKYGQTGVQVVTEAGGPDVVQHGHFEEVSE